MEVELTIVHLHVGMKHTISHVHIPLKGLEDYFPLWKQIEASIQDLKEVLDPRNICLYWRANDERFVPVYDYVTYRAMLTQLAERRLYLVLRDRAAQNEERMVAESREITAPSWSARCAAHLFAEERHPSVARAARGADLRLLTRLFPGGGRGLNRTGYVIQDAAQTKQVLDTALGVPIEVQVEEDEEEKGKNGKKSKTDKKGKKSKTEKKSKKGSKKGKSGKEKKKKK